MKIIFTCTSYVPHMTSLSNFLYAVTSLHVLYFDVLRRQLEIETESKNFVYGYNAGQLFVKSTQSSLQILACTKCV